MEATNGLGVILENRYYGQSYPFEDMSTDHLAYLTTEQSSSILSRQSEYPTSLTVPFLGIADNAYFAQHATFKGVNATLQAPSTPWILYGGSLAGAQTAWSIKTYGDILFGGIGSSATTYATLAYPQWYDPIQKLAPQDCVSSINNIISNFDSLVAANNTAGIAQFKSIFGLAELSDIRDFAMTIAFPLGGPLDYPTNTWQELLWDPSQGSRDFWDFCANVTNLDAPADITAIDYALANYTGGVPWTNLGNYANYVKNVLVEDYCTSTGQTVEQCYSTQNVSYWADESNSGNRAYMYSTCTEAGLYQTARDTSDGPSLISQVLQPSYTQEWCNWSFAPGTYNSIPATPNTTRINQYGGLSVEADRLAHIDGANDVWLDVCYHSHEAPERVSSDLRPEYLITGAGHHWDSYGLGGLAEVGSEPQFIEQAHLWEIRVVKRWLEMGW